MENPYNGLKNQVEDEAERLATLKFGRPAPGYKPKTPRMTYYELKGAKAQTAVEYAEPKASLDLNALQQGDRVLITATDPDDPRKTRQFFVHGKRIEDITQIRAKLASTGTPATDTAPEVWNFSDSLPDEEGNIQKKAMPVLTIGDALVLDGLAVGGKIKKIERFGQTKDMKDISPIRQKNSGRRNPLNRLEKLVALAETKREEERLEAERAAVAAAARPAPTRRSASRLRRVWHR
jgi:hypothetical protein